jgi:hypothetical protein
MLLVIGTTQVEGLIRLGSVVWVRSEDIGRSQRGDVMKLGWRYAGIT